MIHSFYLMRDGKDRARVHLTGQSGRAVGAKVELLTKIHADGPEPIYDGLLPYAAAIAEGLAQRTVRPGVGKRESACGPWGDAVDALVPPLLDAFVKVEEATHRWPPPLETVGQGPLTEAARALRRACDALAQAPPSKEAFDARHVDASLIGPMQRLSRVLLAAAKLLIKAYGTYVAVEHGAIDEVDEGQNSAGGLRAISAGGRLAEALKTPEGCVRAAAEAQRIRDEALLTLYPARRVLAALRPLYYEQETAAERLAATLVAAPVCPKLSARVGLHKPQRASVHAREERRGG